MLNKNEIFPIPKKGDILEFKKIILKTDDEDEFKLRFFIHNLFLYNNKTLQKKKRKRNFRF